MSAYKDKTQGTWYVSFRYIDWTGKKTQKLKRGFKTKKEALNYEKEFIRKTAADMKMEMNSFIQVYFEDKKNELKENSLRDKEIIGKVSFRRKSRSTRTLKRNWQKFRRIIRNYPVRKKFCRELQTDITDFYACWGKIW